MNNSKIINSLMSNRRKIGIFLIYFYFVNCNFTFTQEMTNDFFDYKYNNIIHNSNLNDWNTKTSFGPIRYQESNFKFKIQKKSSKKKF